MNFGIVEGLKEFTSTFKEWHYLIGGVSIGIIVGILFSEILNLLRFLYFC